MRFIKSPAGLIVLVLVIFAIWSMRGRAAGQPVRSAHTTNGGPRATAGPVVATSAAVEGWTP